MLVCPECRNENPEAAKFCTRCGRALNATETALRRLERREPTDEIDIAVPKPPNPVWGILGIVAAAITVLAVGAWWLLRPNPCEGKQASPQFPYCVEIPTGWEQATEEIGEGQQADTYAPPSGDAAILVVAEQVQSGTDTSAYAENQRNREEAGGLFPGPIERLDVAGHEAVSWEVTTTTQGGTVVHQLQVALVRGGTGWVITYVGNEESFPRDRDLFQQVLETWSFQ
jgi:hypothetical protein